MKFIPDVDVIFSSQNIDKDIADKLPEMFTFYGFPLRIKNCDGSPVRAIAVVE